ncbi:protein SET-like [Ischnura elegans]|uniref:protein SET-like n=1 Tax=Ischnura elegans TaxID=197161 RepID=UPI001ED8A2B5|nr:protein SET-like [Ischnura elegans]
MKKLAVAAAVACVARELLTAPAFCFIVGVVTATATEPCSSEEASVDKIQCTTPFGRTVCARLLRIVLIMSSASKVPKMDGSGDGVEDGDYDPETRIALEEIDLCQKELDSLNERCSEEILEVERRYNQLRKPFYDKRNDVIQRIPKFWATAFVSHPELNYLMEEEEDLLQFLTKLEVEEFDDIRSGYRIKFHFEENPYFENDILTKDFYLSKTPASECTVIKWKEGKEPKELTKPKEVVGGSSPGRKRAAERRAFFDWYTDNNSPTVDEIAEVIKDELWPNPLHYYLAPVCDVEYTVLNGDASGDEDCHYQSMEEEEEEAEEDSDAEEDEDDSEEEEDEAETDEEADENEEVEDNDEAEENEETEENEGAEDNEEPEEEEAEDEDSEGADGEEDEEMHNNSGDM